jgi:hypothetical protein
MTSRFKNAKVTKQVKFMNEDVEIKKLTVNQVSKIQDAAKGIEETTDSLDSLRLLCFVAREGSTEMAELTDEEMFDFPMDELSKLSDAIMVFSGLGKPVK